MIRMKSMTDVAVRLVAVATFLVLVVTGEPTNLALGKMANASSVYTTSYHVEPGYVTDGSNASNWDLMSCFGTAYLDWEPWWLVDLEDVYTIAGFKVISRSDCCGDRLQDFTVETFLQNPADYPTAVASHCYFYSGYPVPGVPEVVNCDQHVQGRYFRVRRNATTDTDSLILCEVEVYEAPTGSKCNQFAGSMNLRASNGQSIAADSPVTCAEACSNMLCRAFNFRWAETPECQVVPQLTGEPEFEQGWRFYKRNEC